MKLILLIFLLTPSSSYGFCNYDKILSFVAVKTGAMLCDTSTDMVEARKNKLIHKIVAGDCMVQKYTGDLYAQTNRKGNISCVGRVTGIDMENGKYRVAKLKTVFNIFLINVKNLK